MGVGGHHHDPAALPPVKTQYPMYWGAGWGPGPVWTGAENLAPTGIRSPYRPARSESLYRVSCCCRLVLPYRYHMSVFARQHFLFAAVKRENTSLKKYT